MSPHDEQAFQTRIRALYQCTADEIDTATAARLREARRKALAARRGLHLGRWLFPLGAVAACLLAVVVIWPSTPRHPATTSPQAVSASAGDSDDTALPPDPDNNDPAMYQDMDFYAWLADQSHATSKQRGG